MKNPKIVCLGGGIGTVNLLRGIKQYSHNITVIVSMADDGGSAGRLRRLYSVPPPGDLMNCLAVLSNAEPTLKQLLTYRFKGNRWGKDDSLGGQKLGNLILVALTNLSGSFDQALSEAQRLFDSYGEIIPATQENVSIWAMTTDNIKVIGEQRIDLGQYKGKRSLSQVFLTPQKITTSKKAIRAINQADLIIAGPGDLYTTLLPVLLVPEIQKALKKAQAKRVFIVNVANKPFETPNYSVQDFIQAVEKHLKSFPFDFVLSNNNFKPKMPEKLKYSYVTKQKSQEKKKKVKIVEKDLVDKKFPLYHDSGKIARAVLKLI